MRWTTIACSTPRWPSNRHWPALAPRAGMRIAVIGAGIVGVTTAFELAADGHEVHVYERHGSVAGGTSFAITGMASPGFVGPWAAPGMQRRLLRSFLGRHSGMRVH